MRPVSGTYLIVPSVAAGISSGSDSDEVSESGGGGICEVDGLGEPIARKSRSLQDHPSRPTSSPLHYIYLSALYSLAMFLPSDPPPGLRQDFYAENKEHGPGIKVPGRTHLVRA
ncbi:hypothetical protein Tco_0720811 [Tanacetum coccineum]